MDCISSHILSDLKYKLGYVLLHNLVEICLCMRDSISRPDDCFKRSDKVLQVNVNAVQPHNSNHFVIKWHLAGTEGLCLSHVTRSCYTK